MKPSAMFSGSSTASTEAGGGVTFARLIDIERGDGESATEAERAEAGHPRFGPQAPGVGADHPGGEAHL
jgi:hypothetical protein